MPRPVNVAFSDDPEFTQFSDIIKSKQLSAATAKSYKSSYRKIRALLDKPIRDTAEDTACKVIQAAEDNINTQQALINVCILVRQMHPEMPVEEYIRQRTVNKEDVQEHLRQANSFKVLPALEEYDAFIQDLWDTCKYREYIINYLMRHYYTRNLDLIFDITETKNDTLKDKTKNYLWINRRKQSILYIRNNYKTARTYGQKSYEIKNERFIRAVKACHKQMYAFPICNEPTLIGYYITKMSFNQLGESNCLKIIINHYRDNIKKLEEISRARGTNLQVLLKSYNISYNNDNSE